MFSLLSTATLQHHTLAGIALLLLIFLAGISGGIIIAWLLGKIRKHQATPQHPDAWKNFDSFNPW
jgi:Na+-transporting methylmalonyl-CoA/oxaloacetate decarboxylase beta subunit